MISQALPYLQFAATLFTLLGMLYAFYRFTRQPHDSMEQRIEDLERRLRDLEKQVNQNTDYVDKLLACTTALVDFELAYCISTHYDAEGIDDLKHARKILRKEVD